MLGAALPAGALGAAGGGPGPLPAAAVVGAAWPLIAALRGRYAAQEAGESGAVLPVFRDWLAMLGLLAAVCVTVRLEVSAGTWLPALLPCLALTAAHRGLAHRRTLARRRQARGLRRVLVVGEAGAADGLTARMGARTDDEYVVVGGCVPGGFERPEDAADAEGAVDTATVLERAAELGADTVFVVPGRWTTGEGLRRLARTLHDDGRSLAVVPGLVDVSRRRLRLTRAAGMTVLHVEPAPRRGLPVLLKRITDRVGALLLTAVLSPVLLGVAAAVRLSSPGPVIYRQLRVGQGRRPFPMWKFRTMVEAADRMRPALEAANEHDGAMFKIREDPRVTPLGRFLRRYSLDELPQLFNVLAGHMSLVGPRPPLPEEVERYDDTELRRLSVKPGITGLWQVSGRSDLSWDETVALDLRYVDNWSYAGDVGILARTFRAVVSARGAY
ncbi:exopolysaccharide biosynthesis polyprenyl glycosylphosphotransferase [Streptomyces pini]|uniref:Exopolysaccharide biosynthesis polyprenyl glycosylphosphotransferase n=1 Tax=Streptomyces pini TaxID=1520580 RepID=A0A1I3X9A7_9ACTN|nr:exopolysaccharide biosynthesis polyprenyl glycosylphosphotransferase [Streptomyces pini]